MLLVCGFDIQSVFSATRYGQPNLDEFYVLPIDRPEIAVFPYLFAKYLTHRDSVSPFSLPINEQHHSVVIDALNLVRRVRRDWKLWAVAKTWYHYPFGMLSEVAGRLIQANRHKHKDGRYVASSASRVGSANIRQPTTFTQDWHFGLA